MPKKGQAHRYYHHDPGNAVADAGEELCALCGRPIPGGVRDWHHLIPKSKGGRVLVALHRICHRQLHALFTESELAHRLNTIERLLEEPAVQTFVSWVKQKPPGFSERTSKSARLRRD